MSRLVAALLIACALSFPAAAGTRALYSFQGGNDGATPTGRLLLFHGDLYGTTMKGGGTGCERGEGCGTVFKLSPDGTETVLHRFQSGDNDGAEPTAGLIAGRDGNLYGTTSKGGGFKCHKRHKGCGVIFKITPDGTLTLLHVFAGHGFGGTPVGPLVFDRDGNLYGTTMFRGGGRIGYGIVYKLAPDGTFTRLFRFSLDPSKGVSPSGGLIRDAQGNLYGVTRYGGGHGSGALYKLAPDGTNTSLHDFDFPDGGYPSGEVVSDADGSLYGTTSAGGGVYKLTPDGTYSVLYTFAGGDDGAGPLAGVILDADGNLYGTTSRGGGERCARDAGCGTVFKLAPDGTKTTLYSFEPATGSIPTASLIMDRRGNLYGTASRGGANGFGSVFETHN